MIPSSSRPPRRWPAGSCSKGRANPGAGPCWRSGWVLARPPLDEELAALVTFQARQADRFRSGELEPNKIIGEGVKLPEGTTAADLAAWTATARALLNLDETITKE